MPRFRSRCAAAVLALVLVLAPLASASPFVPAADSWWSALVTGFDGLLGLVGLGDTGIVTVRAPEGPALEPDGFSVQLTDPEVDDTPTRKTPTPQGGGVSDPNG